MKYSALFCSSVLSGLLLIGCGGGSSSSTPPPVVTIPPAPVVTESPVVIQDIEYTQAATQDGDMPLLLDIYQPEASCSENRPTVLFVHGGAFLIGDKSSETITALAEATNEKGFNFVSIQYRLVGDDPVLSATYQDIAGDFLSFVPLLQRPLVTSAVAATEDTVTALNWMEDNANEFCLDTTRLAYWGSSAGAITVLQVGYGLNQFGIERPEPKVVIDYWGDLVRDSDMEFREAPLFILHGDDDDTVPYQGALDLQTQADSVGVPFAFYTVAGGGHAFSEIDIFELTSNDIPLIDHTMSFIEAHLIGGAPNYVTETVTQ